MPDTHATEAQRSDLKAKVHEACTHEMDILSVQIHLGYGDDVNAECVATCLAQQHAAYNCYSIPRLAGLTAAAIKLFLELLHGSAVIAASAADVPLCTSKLVHVGRELWTQWGMLGE